MMNNKQINELNELLVNHSEVLTAFYDEGINYGMNKGCAYGIIGSLIGVGIVCGISIIKSQKNKNKDES